MYSFGSANGLPHKMATFIATKRLDNTVYSYDQYSSTVWHLPVRGHSIFIRSQRSFNFTKANNKRMVNHSVSSIVK